MENSVFFGDNGLTSTSANHIANLAKEYIKNLEDKLKGSHFFNTDINLIGSHEKNRTQNGVDDSFLENLPKDLQTIADAKSLIAWLREAIKAKDELYEKISNMSIDDYCKIKGIKAPQYPTKDQTLTEKEYYDSLPIKERNRYYSLETQAAVIGKYIHPDGILDDRRNTLNEILQAPHEIEGSGRDTIVYTYSPSVDPEKVESTFFELQRKHRSIQAELNSMKAACEDAVRTSKLEVLQKFQAEMSEYNQAHDTLSAELREYVQKEDKKLRKLKIVIPDKLRPVYELISNLGK